MKKHYVKEKESHPKQIKVANLIYMDKRKEIIQSPFLILFPYREMS